MQPTPLYSPQPIIISKMVAASYFILIRNTSHFYPSKINAAYSSLLSTASSKINAAYSSLLSTASSKINAAYSSLLSTAYHHRQSSSCFVY